MVFTVNVLLLMGLKGEIRGWENLETRENSQRSTICCCGLTELGKTLNAIVVGSLLLSQRNDIQLYLLSAKGQSKHAIARVFDRCAPTCCD